MKKDRKIQISPNLSQNVNLLGSMLGECISETEGAACLEKIEHIRALAKESRANGSENYKDLVAFLNQLSNKELLPVARAFSHFLNFSNIVDQHHMISREMDDQMSATNTLEKLFTNLKQDGHSDSDLKRALKDLKIELVLTAHPTEITRRSLINKHTEMDSLLSQLELKGHTGREQKLLEKRLAELIAQIWHTWDFREHRPTPVDEAKWGFAVVENSLWEAVPNFMRRLESTSLSVTKERLPLEFAPVSFAFWMGGDRDGNPNVTSKVTKEVLLLSRWKATDLYLRDLQTLIDELSMSQANESLLELAENSKEPYRFVLRKLRALLQNNITDLGLQLKGEAGSAAPRLNHIDQLWNPLVTCYQSLHECGMGTIAESKLLDLLRRVQCFGIHLVRFDIRQESDRHTEVMSELTQYLELGDYGNWNEEERQSFLLKELQSNRPLIPRNWEPSETVQEVLNTCQEISRHESEAFGAYVISMARAPSDVLLVQLLMKESGLEELLPVAPLFETLDDLNNAASIMDQLLSNAWYRNKTDGQQTVMIGYSDSAKDAGVMAAGWAQYRAQQGLIQVCDKAGVSLTLFHGRGGTIGRGGAPAHAALLSQPPGSLTNGLRVTEQGEMIRAKLGINSIAIKSLALYTSAILQANLSEPPVPKPEWQDAMDQLSQNSCKHYRDIVRGEPEFVSWFRTATPEPELGKLPLGSRPSRRKPGGGIETLRAIPWIFAWSQNRLMLPAWLGAGQALQEFIDEGKKSVLEEMCQQWPFFSTRISMLEMVFAKADTNISEYYDSVLVDDDKRSLGERLRRQLAADSETVDSIHNDTNMVDDIDQVFASIAFRATYIDPLNLLQAELLRRNREQEDTKLEHALMVTIAGIAAGLRNTG